MEFKMSIHVLVENEPHLAALLHPYYRVSFSHNLCEILHMLESSAVDMVIAGSEALLDSGYCDKIIFYPRRHKPDTAQKAIQKGVAGYVVKAEGYQRILQEVQRFADRLESANLPPDERQKRLTSALPLLQNSVLLNVFEWMTKDEAQKEMRSHHVDIDVQRPVMLVAIRIDEFPDAFSPAEDFLMLMQVNNLIHNLLRGPLKAYHASFEHRNMVWILQTEEDTWEPLKSYIPLLTQVQLLTKEKFDISLSIIYDRWIAFDDIHTHYQRLLSILSLVSVNGEAGVFSDCDFYQNRLCAADPEDQLLLYKGIDDLKIALNAQNLLSFQRVLKELLYGPRPADFAHKLETYHILCSIMLEYIETHGLYEQMLHKPEDFELFQTYKGRKQLMAALCDLAERFFAQRDNGYRKRGNTTLVAVHTFIQKNLAGDLSLQTIAKALYLNPSYLSRWYKQQTGHTLSDEISTRRLQLAKKMLLRSEMKITQIAKVSGFESAAYFSRIFTKKEGISPSQWRSQRGECKNKI